MHALLLEDEAEMRGYSLARLGHRARNHETRAADGRNKADPSWWKSALPVAQRYAARHMNYSKTGMAQAIKAEFGRLVPDERAIRESIKKWKEAGHFSASALDVQVNLNVHTTRLPLPRWSSTSQSQPCGGQMEKPSCCGKFFAFRLSRMRQVWAAQRSMRGLLEAHSRSPSG
jgi:hypothetical protein